VNKLTLIVILAIVAGITSCTPKSAMMTKAVIIDSDPRAIDAQTSYKVALLSYDVIDYFIAYQKYETGDTILIHDKWRNYEIR
jgi:hypothetical protein